MIRMARPGPGCSTCAAYRGLSMPTTSVPSTRSSSRLAARAPSASTAQIAGAIAVSSTRCATSASPALIVGSIASPGEAAADNTVKVRSVTS